MKGPFMWIARDTHDREPDDTVDWFSQMLAPLGYCVSAFGCSCPVFLAACFAFGGAGGLWPRCCGVWTVRPGLISPRAFACF